MTIKARLRISGYAFRRAAWRLRYLLPRFDAPSHEPILVVLGMHRSGTSSAVGLWRISVHSSRDNASRRARRKQVRHTPAGRVDLAFKPHTSNERVLSALTTKDGGQVYQEQIANPNRIVRLCAERRCVLKDPRMLLMLDFWDGVLINPMAVVRNPVDVAESRLVRRGEPGDATTMRRVVEDLQSGVAELCGEPRLPDSIFRSPQLHRSGHTLRTSPRLQRRCRDALL